MNEEKYIYCKKNIDFSASKNSTSIANSSAKKNANVKRKNRNESRIHDEMLKCWNFKDSIFITLKLHQKGIANPSRLDRNCHNGGILVYLKESIPFNFVKFNQKFENFEGFFIITIRIRIV